MATDPQPQIRLDAIDLKIIAELQANGRIQNNQLAERVGISPPPCLRRVRVLFENGIIKSVRAILNEKMLGYEITYFVLVQLESQTEIGLKAFEEQIMLRPNIKSSWLLSGEADYLLHCIARNVETMQSVVLGFAKMPNVRNVRSLMVLRDTKDATLPIPAQF